MDMSTNSTDFLNNMIAWVLVNFSLTMFFLAFFFIILHRLIMRRGISVSEIIYRWIALFPLGIASLYVAFMHAYYPDMSAAAIGWQPSPFQWEVAMADLAIGVLGILSFNASFGFRLATVIGATICLWGDACGHFYQMVQQENYTVGNAGSWLWTDIAIPLILIICILKLKPKHKKSRV